MRVPILALAAPSGIVLLAWWLYQMRPTTAMLWLLGIGLGITLHRTRFCIAAAFRDTYLFRDTGPAKALLLALSLSSLTFGVLQIAAARVGQTLPGNLYPISAATIAGALIFGIGIVPAGGCVCSALLRLGEGHVRYVWTLAGLLAGSLLGAYHRPWWEGLTGSAAPLHFPTVLGWPLAAMLYLGLFSALYGLITWWETRKAVSP